MMLFIYLFVCFLLDSLDSFQHWNILKNMGGKYSSTMKTLKDYQQRGKVSFPQLFSFQRSAAPFSFVLLMSHIKSWIQLSKTGLFSLIVSQQNFHFCRKHYIQEITLVVYYAFCDIFMLIFFLLLLSQCQIFKSHKSVTH